MIIVVAMLFIAILMLFIWSGCRISGKCSDYEDATYTQLTKGGKTNDCNHYRKV